MEMKLVVLAGAKRGTAVPLKRDKFTIGRASECTLRAGSEAISRRHCLIARTDEGWSVQDLGSRNGTFVNDQRIEEETPLCEGDELRVGPLKFRADRWERKESSPDADSSESKTGLKASKQPPVKDVADAAARTVEAGEGGDYEEDISRWLIGVKSGSQATQDTQSFRVEDTKSAGATGGESAGVEDESTAEASTPDGDADQENDNGAEVASEGSSKSSGVWGLFGKGKSKTKETPKRRKPGKLPKVPNRQKSKDSGEAAADVLREMTRRR